MSANPSTSIEPVDQKTVLFYDDELTAVRSADDQVYVSVRHVCQALSIDVQAQMRRIRRNRVLKQRLMVAKMATTQGDRDTFVLRVDMLPLFLAGISTGSISDDATREKLERFQDEAAKVLWDAFRTGRLTSPEPLDALISADTPAARAYKMARAVMALAEQQLLLERQLERHAGALADHGQRLEQIEATLGDPKRHISAAQASRISQAVKAVALSLGQRSGRNEFGGVYGELYRRFDIAGYRELPAARYEEAINFLRQWYQSVNDDGAVPF